MITDSDVRQEKARNLRYKKAISANLNSQAILDDLEKWSNDCQAIEASLYQIDLDEVFGGDDESAEEFRMAFGMLSGDINELYDSLNYDHEYFMDWFDELFPAIKASGFGGYLGYDSYEQDYYPLEWWESEYAESESRKKMLRLTKHQILDRVGKALAIIANYISIKYRYDCLETSINVIKGVNVANAELVKGIEAAYEAAYNATNGTFGKCPEVARLDDLEWQLPAQCWL